LPGTVERALATVFAQLFWHIMPSMLKYSVDILLPFSRLRRSKVSRRTVVYSGTIDISSLPARERVLFTSDYELSKLMDKHAVAVRTVCGARTVGTRSNVCEEL
jgi:hypothetical protein